jgi:hypothetical protein
MPFPKGHKLPEETKRKISEANMGRIVSQETRNKISMGNKGHTTSEETKRKIREARKKQIFSEEARKHMSEAQKRRTPESYRPHNGHSAAWKEKINRGNGYIAVHDPNHPRSDCRGMVLEHIAVWEKFHNKRLPQGFVIHHLNGIKDDNRPNNLVAMKAGEHVNQREPYKKRIRELELEIDRLKQMNFDYD